MKSPEIEVLFCISPLPPWAVLPWLNFWSIYHVMEWKTKAIEHKIFSKRWPFDWRRRIIKMFEVCTWAAPNQCFGGWIPYASKHDTQLLRYMIERPLSFQNVNAWYPMHSEIICLVHRYPKPEVWFFFWCCITMIYRCTSTFHGNGWSILRCNCCFMLVLGGRSLIAKKDCRFRPWSCTAIWGKLYIAVFRKNGMWQKSIKPRYLVSWPLWMPNNKITNKN